MIRIVCYRVERRGSSVERTLSWLIESAVIRVSFAHSGHRLGIAAASSGHSPDPVQTLDNPILIKLGRVDL